MLLTSLTPISGSDTAGSPTPERTAEEALHKA